MTCGISITAISNCPDVSDNDDIGAILVECIGKQNLGVEEGDIFCVAQKVVSKAEGRLVKLSDVVPSEKARFYAKELNKDPRKIEVILRESNSVVRYFKHHNQDEGVIICQHRLGFISANAGVDESNVKEKDNVLLLPKDPDMSARFIRRKLESKFGVRVGVVITDTFGRPWRIGQINVAIGLAGVPATLSEKGNKDAFGGKLLVTEPAFCDELSAASGLVIDKSSRTPFVLIRGLRWKEHNQNAKDIVRLSKEDVFL